MGIISVPLYFENTAYVNSNEITKTIQEILFQTETIWDFIPLPINSFDQIKTTNEQFLGFVFDLNISPAYIVLIYKNDKNTPVISLKVLINKSEQTSKTKKLAINQMEFILDDAIKKSSEILSL